MPPRGKAVPVPTPETKLVLDMPLRVTFEQRGDMAVPVFTPAQDRR